MADQNDQGAQVPRGFASIDEWCKASREILESNRLIVDFFEEQQAILERSRQEEMSRLDSFFSNVQKPQVS
jgi:hypothetical protein